MVQSDINVSSVGIVMANQMTLDTDTFFESYVIAQDVLMGKYPDITEGATHYHSIMVEPYWAETLNETVQIQHHIFYK